MKKIITIVVVLTFLYSCSNTPTTKLSVVASNPVKDNLIAVAAEINKRCPMAVEETTRMDSLVVFNEYLMTYYYTVHTVNSKDVDLKKFKLPLEIGANVKYNTDAKLAVFRENKVAIAYDYKDKNGNFLCYFICRGK